MFYGCSWCGFDHWTTYRSISGLGSTVVPIPVPIKSRKQRLYGLILALLDPQRALAVRALPGDELRMRGRSRARRRRRGRLHIWRREKRALADGHDVRDPERVQHVCVRGVVPAIGHRLSVHSMQGRQKTEDAQVAQVQERQYPAREAPVEPWVVEPNAVVAYRRCWRTRRWHRVGPRATRRILLAGVLAVR